MLPSQLKKDRSDTIRTSEEVKAKLKAMGLSIQKFFDLCIDEKLPLVIEEKSVSFIVEHKEGGKNNELKNLKLVKRK